MAKPPIDPQRWQPPRAVKNFPTSITADRVISVPGVGPEDVLVRPDGAIWTGVADGRIFSIDPRTSSVTLVADTKGRPLGLENHPDGGTVICDAHRGLLHLSQDADITVLASEAEGTPLHFTNNAAVGADGTIWFTDSSQRFSIEHYLGDLMEHKRTGRLIRRDPDGTLTVVLDGLAFANGVALLEDESAVIVAQTGNYSLVRYDVVSGESRNFGGSLPGFPDNISLGTDGLVWVAIASPRNPLMDTLFPKEPKLRTLLWSLPDWMLPSAKSLIQVQAFDTNGDLIHDLSGKHPQFGMATGVRRHEDLLWLGSLESSTIAAVSL